MKLRTRVYRTIERWADWIGDDTARRILLRFAKRSLEKKLKAIHVIPVERAKMEEIKEFWSRYDRSIDYRWFDVYNSLEGDYELKYYIPVDAYFTKCDMHFANWRDGRVLDNKNFYDFYFHDVKQPESVVHCIDGVFSDGHYNHLEFAEAVEACKSAGHVILKVALQSSGGSGVSFWNAERDAVSVLERMLCSSKDYIVQRVVKQHPAVAEIHPTSLNTIRMMTLLRDGKAKVLSSVFRMGVGGSMVDNASVGGIFCGIEPDGRLKNFAYNLLCQKFDQHPTGGRLDRIVIPNFDRCVELVERLAQRFVGVSKLLSWDLAIDEQGDPVVIEVNMSTGGIDFHQLCNGPIYGDATPEILDEVYGIEQK